MPRRMSGLLVLAAAATWLLVAAGPALGADPTPSPVTTAHETLITTNARVGEELVWWGLRLLILCFIGLAGAALIGFIKGLLTKPQRAGDLVAGGLTDVLAATLKMIPELIKTPAGIGGLLLILGVLMLLGTAAIETNQFSDTPLSTEAATSPAPTRTPEPVPSLLPTASG